MRGNGFTESQITKIRRQVESGTDVADLARECGGRTATIYTWRSKHSGLKVNQAERPREFEKTKRKQIVAESTSDIRTLKLITSRKW